MLFVINQVSNTVGSNYFRVIGSHAQSLATATHIQVRNSAANSGIYKVVSATDVSGYTHIAVEEPIPSTIADGQLNTGVYQLDFSDPSIEGKEPIVVAPATIDTDSLSIALPGRGAYDYGERLVENAIHVLENFAGSVPPANPTVGQHWYDSATKTIKVWVGSSWSSDVNIENGTLSFKDPQNAVNTSKVVLTASEPTEFADTGLTVYPEDDVEPGSPIFRVLSSEGDIHFSVARDDAIRTDLRFVADSTATNELKGKLMVGTPSYDFSTGSVTLFGGNVDLSGKLIVNESAQQHGIYGLNSNSSIRTVAGVWTVHSTDATAVTFSNSDGIVASLGTVSVFSRPVTIHGELNVSANANMTNIGLSGALIAPSVQATTELTSPSLTVAGSLVSGAAGTRLLRSLDVNNQRIQNVTAPAVATDAVNKQYVDDNDYLDLMGDVSLDSPTDKEVLRFNATTSKWINAPLDTSYIGGFGNNVKDQAAAMIDDGTHVGLTPSYNSSTKAMSFSLNARPLAMTGDVTGNTNINWSGNTSMALTLASTGVTAGTYAKVTVDTKGRVLSGAILTASDIPTITSDKITGDYDLKNTNRVVNALDPVNAGDYVTLRYLQNYTFDAGAY